MTGEPRERVGDEDVRPPDKGEVEETSKKFFATWEKGRAPQAASYTNGSQEAGALLTGFGKEAHIGGVRITPGTATGTTVPFTVKATVTHEGKSEPLSYRSELTAVRGQTTGRALVDWDPSVVPPGAGRGRSRGCARSCGGSRSRRGGGGPPAPTLYSPDAGHDPGLSGAWDTRPSRPRHAR